MEFIRGRRRTNIFKLFIILLKSSLFCSTQLQNNSNSSTKSEEISSDPTPFPVRIEPPPFPDDLFTNSNDLTTSGPTKT